MGGIAPDLPPASQEEKIRTLQKVLDYADNDIDDISTWTAKKLVGCFPGRDAVVLRELIGPNHLSLEDKLPTKKASSLVREMRRYLKWLLQSSGQGGDDDQQSH